VSGSDFADLKEKYSRLIKTIAAQGSAAVAFSGGVDSSFLCHAAAEALQEKALAITIVSPMLPKSEIHYAREIADKIGIKHILLAEPIIDDEVAANPKERCYYCKKIEFGPHHRRGEKTRNPHRTGRFQHGRPGRLPSGP